jgi:hypothetical protein
MSMAWLWRDQGKRDEARDLLAPVYGWFTEGFDTLDLKEAKALLEQDLGGQVRSMPVPNSETWSSSDADEPNALPAAGARFLCHPG